MTGKLQKIAALLFPKSKNALEFKSGQYRPPAISQPTHLANTSSNDYLSLIKQILLILFILFASNASAQSVYKTPSGEKYHLADCRMVKNVSEEISVTDARKLGLEPCKICKPADIYTTPPNSKKKSQGEASTAQCLGKTKAGSRCKHMTSIGNGYCYQHQP